MTEQILALHPVGSLVSGQVTEVFINGVSVTIADNVHGWLPIHEIRSLCLKDRLQALIALRDQYVTTVVTGAHEGKLRLSLRQVAVGQYESGSGVRALVLREQQAAGRYVLQLPGDVLALLSTYEIADQDLDQMQAGRIITATVDRVEFDSNGFGHVVLTKEPQTIAC